MDNNEVQLVGGPCGQHGPYTFYKAFKYTKNGVKRIVTLSEFFFVKLWMDSDLVCIGELQLLWADKNSEQVLASLRLYFLPENTPEGRMDHGEDEVLAISEKVVLKVDDLITWITNDAEWSWGRLAKCVDRLKEPQEPQDQQATSVRLTESALDFSDVEKERKLIENKLPGPSVIILSYPRYCRYRSVMKRLEGVEDDYIRHKIVNALGGINVRSDNTRILFCKDTFDYPELEGHELLCNHLAPKLKGRPRGKRKKRSVSPGSESNESESSVSNIFTTGKITTEGGRNGLRCDSTTSPRRSTRATENSESKDFIKKLSMFMKSNRTPMGRIPSLGYKELDLHSFYIKVQKLGGYDSVTANRLWKSIFDDLSGNQASTSAATVIRRHYERFLLAYERHSKGEEYKPLPVSERRRLKSKAGSSSASDAETSESTSRSGNSTPIPHHIPSCSTPCTPTDNKEFYMKMENKPSSLRSVRVKPERLRDATKDKVENCEEEVKHLPEKHPEPTTGAVAPVQKIVPEKSTSPAEGKENIPIFNARDTQTIDDDDDLIEVPYKPESPEIIDLESEVYNTSSMTNNNNNSSSNNNNTQSAVMELKKGKLDILKEGGLEVTPVRHFAVPQSKEPRASVVHPSLEKRQMPPPSINATLIKRPHLPPAQISPKPPKYPQTFTYTPSSPPKIIQSKSIYNPSQKTVYGDPKDLFGHQIHQVQAPKFVPKPPVTDLLDLTVRSPQKPVVEIMRVPPIPSPKIPKNMYNMPALPSLEGRRISSNLEITLVGPSKAPPIPSPPKKRHYPEMFPPNKIPRMEENGRKMHHYQVHPHTSKKHHNIPNPYIRPPTKHDKSLPQLPQLNKYSNHPMPPMYPNYLTPTSTATNKVPYPPIDPMYLQALQNLYPSPMHPVPSPMFPMLSRERLLMYSQLSYSYGMPQENHPSITSSDNNKVKKQ